MVLIELEHCTVDGGVSFVIKISRLQAVADVSKDLIINKNCTKQTHLGIEALWGYSSFGLVVFCHTYLPTRSLYRNTFAPAHQIGDFFGMVVRSELLARLFYVKFNTNPTYIEDYAHKLRAIFCLF